MIRPALASEILLLRAIDDESGVLYAAHGLPIVLGEDNSFGQAEVARWLRSAELGRALLAVDSSGQGVGFAALDILDGAPYLDQLAVRASSMRQGIGGALLAASHQWAGAVGGVAIWLTTYDHLPFNRPYYERHGYRGVPEAECGPGVRHHLEEQRRHLPAPAHRVAMRRMISFERPHATPAASARIHGERSD